jgi:hypothetical protein
MCNIPTLPVSCGPQGKTPGLPQKPALWAVSSTGLLGQGVPCHAGFGLLRLYWLIQKCAEKLAYIRRLNASETEPIPLAKRPPMALEIDCRTLTNRVCSSIARTVAQGWGTEGHFAPARLSSRAISAFALSSGLSCT